MTRQLRHPLIAVAVAIAAVATPFAQGAAAPQGAAPAGRGGPGGPGGRGFAPVQIGPPAPVPPEVAIPRPTPAELEQVNAALKRFIDGDKSSAQPLLKKFEPLMLLQPPRAEHRRHVHADQSAQGAAA